MTPELRRDLLAALERPSRLGTIGGDLEEQLAHCAGFSSVLGRVAVNSDSPYERGIDLGTGGGVPGVVLAALWPMMSWTLVDMRSARADEVERVVLRLGLGERVDVRSIEAQHLGHLPETRERYDVAVARSFGPPSLTAECAAGVVRPGGVLIVSEPPSDNGMGVAPDRWNSEGLRALGFGDPSPFDEPQGRFAVLHKVASTPAALPRLPPRPSRGWPRF